MRLLGMTPEELLVLTNKYLAGTASPEELQKLQQWYMRDTSENSAPEIPLSEGHITEAQMESAIFERIQQSIDKKKPAEAPVHRIGWRRWIAAASVLLLIGFASWFFLLKDNSTTTPSLTAQHMGSDVLPGHDGAILTTANGEKIILDNAENGIIKNEDNSNVVKDGSQLIYHDTRTESVDNVSYNTLTTPNGRKFELVLADGTKVYLDASSSITYPTSFPGNERKVRIIGQAYFEVAKNPSKPFKVNVADKSEVEVLGTHFNVSAFSDEAVIRTTLVEGSVKVSSAAKSLVIKPGQQVWTNADNLQLSGNVDIEEVTAWKNGFTSFRQADIRTIMRQIARWYDVDVEYQGDTPVRTFSADVSRNVNLSKLLKILEASNIRFKIEGRKLIVLP